jgi:hypothetical protein
MLSHDHARFIEAPSPAPPTIGVSMIIRRILLNIHPRKYCLNVPALKKTLVCGTGQCAVVKVILTGCIFAAAELSRNRARNVGDLICSILGLSTSRVT